MNNTSRNYLPHDYQPSSFDIICGRGPACFNHPGNVAFRQVIEKYLDRYGATQNKFEKTQIVLEVAREALRSSGGPSCKVVRWCRIRKLWFELSGMIFRQKVGQTMRDALLMRDPQKRAIKKEKRAFQRVCREHDAPQSIESFGLLENLSQKDCSSNMIQPLSRTKNDDFDGDHTERLHFTLSQVQPQFILPARFNILNESNETSDILWAKNTNYTRRSNAQLSGGNKLEDEASPFIRNVKSETDVCRKSHVKNEGDMLSKDDESDTCSADWFGDIFADL